MYEPQELLAAIDRDTWFILVGFGVAMILQTIWLVDCIRVARREQVYSMPLFCTFFWFAHDLGCAVRFHDWFVTYDHWYLKLYWVGLLSAVFLEIVFLAQAARYGHRELLPGWSRRAFIGLLGVGVVSAVVTWELLKVLLDDPLYQVSPAITLVSYPIFGFALIVRRGSTIGNTPLMWLCSGAMVVIWWAVTMTWFGGGFRSPQYLAAGVLTLVFDLAIAWTVSRRGTLFARATAPRDVHDQPHTTAVRS